MRRLLLPALLALPGCLVETARYEALRAALSDVDGDGVSPRDGDCDDADPRVFPGQPDGCDGVDRDCDGALDEDPDLAWSPDLDGDGFGGAGGEVLACEGPSGWVADASDCDDADPDVFPEATERCNARDDDCDGALDDGLDLVPWYPDADGDGYGTTAGSVLACAAPEGHAAEPADCDDSDAATHPGAPEACGDGIDGDCDGTAIGCGWDGVASLGTTTVVSGAAGDGAGASLALGDVDADGFDDLLVGASANVAYVYAGGADRPAEAWLGLQARAEIRAVALGADFRFGRAVALCDFDAEGGPDLVVTGQDPEDISLVLVFDDASSGRLSEDDARYAVAGFDDRLGEAVACGRTDAGGFDDLVIGAPGLAVRGAANTGAVHVVTGPFGGSTSGWVTDGAYSPPRATVEGDAASQALGSSIAVADIDGDGLGDVLAGAPDDADDGTDAGAAWILYGPVVDGAAASDLGAKLRGPAPGGRAGVVAGGDLDGDGHADVVVGAPSDAGGGVGAGAVYVVAGGSLARDAASVTLNDADARLSGHLPGLRFGDAVAVVGGRFGEGAALAVGAPGADDGGTDAGAVYLWDGRSLVGAAEASDAAPAAWVGAAPGDAAGTSIAGMGDLDGDGWLDLLVGAPGRDDAGSGAGAAHVAWGAGL